MTLSFILLDYFYIGLKKTQNYSKYLITQPTRKTDQAGRKKNVMNLILLLYLWLWGDSVYQECIF